MNIALIGYGGMGKHHLYKLRKLPEYNIVGIYDISPIASKKALSKGYKVYASAEEVAKDKNVDAVLIATPNDSHCDYAVMFAEAGKHIFSEKPVAMNSTELEKMIACANKNKVVFTVNQNRRYDLDFLTIKKIYEENLLGNTYKISSNVMGSHGIPGDWRKESVKGGGMIYDWGVHLVDQALQLVDESVVSVYCKCQYVHGHDVDDGCFIILTFANGSEYQINIETNAFVSLPRWLIYGTNGSAVIKNWKLKGKMVRVRKFVDIYNKGIRAGNGFTKTMAHRSKRTLVVSRLPKLKTDSLSIYKNFMNTINGKEELLIKHKQLIRVMKVLETCFVSDAENQTIKINI